jgi:hypothetical protein
MHMRGVNISETDTAYVPSLHPGGLALQVGVDAVVGLLHVLQAGPRSAVKKTSKHRQSDNNEFRPEL